MSVDDIRPDILACHGRVQAAGHKQNPGLMNPGAEMFAGGLWEELEGFRMNVAASANADHVDANVSGRAGVNAINS